MQEGHLHALTRRKGSLTMEAILDQIKQTNPLAIVNKNGHQ